ncbi:hypothetical protein [Aeromonas phage AS-yj]|uniref:Uncharacterized protein n=5 Tax=Caudoviricetes TaxID=2731619 RepID=A0A291LDZ5_9CAUD|nr:hypothetical protein HWB28_gp173 [Aeromonas phage AS-zj]ATI17617.1 hypothetical protein [Aeromonas phage AS-szw]ATI17890.1 hypothetical protein [Aeromonas phage AS-yj]QAX97651.1 hypothetical protein ASswx1_5 [Aeromonas phage Asswx_1]QAX98901.1 hypothetical protein assk_104 [Aeromonas phage Assk]QMV29062.1 hypothetical protein AP1_0355 [Aeromonas phage AP1]UKM62686.1 hypothetical protein P19_0198 [Aeromonas phage P19]
MNGRRIRGIKPSRVTKINRQIQLMNDQIANCHRILEEVEYTLQPGDYLGGRIEDHYNYSTWRTVGVLNLTDHFIVRYFQRVENIKVKDSDIIKEYPEFTPADRDMYTVWYMGRVGILDVNAQIRIREFVKNPPDSLRVVRNQDRVITILTENQYEY